MKVICDWDNCKEVGSYKAPIERDNSKKYKLLFVLKPIQINSTSIMFTWQFSSCDGSVIACSIHLYI